MCCHVNEHHILQKPTIRSAAQTSNIIYIVNITSYSASSNELRNV